MYQAALQTSRSWSVARDCSASPRNYNYKRYYQPGTGRYLGVDQKREDTSYSYTLGNPLVGIDPYADITIIVHGTFATGAEWAQNGSAFADAAKRYFGDARVLPFNWCGGNFTEARVIAGFQLVRLIEQLRRTWGVMEPINIVAHSHGGNVVKWATQMGATIDRVINLGTPQNGTLFNRSNVGEITNVYSNDDGVQVRGGRKYRRSNRFETGPAGRVDPQADYNFEIEIDDGPLDAHSRLHEPGVLGQIKLRRYLIRTFPIHY